MEKAWDFDTYDWVDEYDSRMRAKGRLHYEETLRLLPDLSEAQAGDAVLDIGTGTGSSAVPFLECGCSVVGLDPSRRMLQQAEARAEAWAGRFRVQQADDPFLAIPFPDETFDVVVAAYAIHHLDEDATHRAIREMKRVLQTGGCIAVADTVFRDAAHKARALVEHPDLEDEYQPLLDAFPGWFRSEGLATALHPIGPLVWVLVARDPAKPGAGTR